MGQAIVYTELGGPEVLRLVERPAAAPGAGELVIRVEAVGVNPIEGKLRAGLRPSGPFAEPRLPGTDAAGSVTAVGAGVEGFRAGDAVVVASAPGTYASEIVVPAVSAWLRPAAVTAATGAALGVPAGTAYQTVRSLAVTAGDTLLVHGGSGSVGQAVIQFAVLQGATVVATASPARADRVRALGAIPVAYGDGLADRVRAAAPQGVTVAIDAVGTDEALATSLELVADHDRIATLVRGAQAAGLGIRAFGGGSPHPLTPRQVAWRAEAIPVTLALLAAGAFSVELGPSFPLAEAGAAQAAVAAGTAGKITLVP
ncbi:NADP-dependent oxidoreductase [Microbacterium sp. X-17]|uniref:quinone oxidoreductase family protein n=1 Tax=Microbacterium sp. X-17 TaxID=3144404 RepID=UPI0031F5BF32